MPDEQPEGAETQSGDDGPEAAAEPLALGEREAALLARLDTELGDAIVEHGDACGDLVVRVRPDAWRRVGEVARDALECDYLSFISAIDWSPATRPEGDTSGDTSTPAQPTEITYGVAGSAGRFQVFARCRVDASALGSHAQVRRRRRRSSRRVVGAGVPGRRLARTGVLGDVRHRLRRSPGLRHLYLPVGFEGHPLRKDFPLLAREVKPWPGLVDVEAMPGEAAGDDGGEA